MILYLMLASMLFIDVFMGHVLFTSVAPRRKTDAVGSAGVGEGGFEKGLPRRSKEQAQVHLFVANQWLVGDKDRADSVPCGR